MSQSELRTDAITVGPNMAHNAKGSIFSNDIENLINNFRMGFHEKVRARKKAQFGAVDFILAGNNQTIAILR